MIHINAVQRIPDTVEELEKPLRLDLTLEAKSPKDLSESLLLLANSIDEIVKSIKQPLTAE